MNNNKGLYCQKFNQGHMVIRDKASFSRYLVGDEYIRGVHGYTDEGGELKNN